MERNPRPPGDEIGKGVPKIERVVLNPFTRLILSQESRKRLADQAPHPREAECAYFTSSTIASARPYSIVSLALR